MWAGLKPRWNAHYKLTSNAHLHCTFEKKCSSRERLQTKVTAMAGKLLLLLLFLRCSGNGIATGSCSGIMWVEHRGVGLLILSLSSSCNIQTANTLMQMEAVPLVLMIALTVLAITTAQVWMQLLLHLQPFPLRYRSCWHMCWTLRGVRREQWSCSHSLGSGTGCRRRWPQWSLHDAGTKKNLLHCAVHLLPFLFLASYNWSRHSWHQWLSVCSAECTISGDRSHHVLWEWR